VAHAHTISGLVDANIWVHEYVWSPQSHELQTQRAATYLALCCVASYCSNAMRSNAQLATPRNATRSAAYVDTAFKASSLKTEHSTLAHNFTKYC